MHISILLFDDVDLLDGEPITAYGGLGLVPSASAERTADQIDYVWTETSMVG